MKIPKLKDLGGVKHKDAFSQSVANETKKSNEMVRKTFSMRQSEVDYISGEALKLSKKTGKVVSASEALRLIIRKGKEGGR